MTQFPKMDGGYGFGHSLSYIPNWNAIVGTIKDNEDCIESRRSRFEIKFSHDNLHQLIG